MESAVDKDQQFDALKAEVVRLFDAIQKIKSEIAAIKHPKSDFDHFNTVADQLQAIVGSTEMATNDIMEATEVILSATAEAEADGTSEDARKAALQRITDSTNHIFESCSFHDITGQRISKIVKTMNLIEGTLNSLVVLVGEQGLAALPMEVRKVDDTDVEGEPLHGPALGSEGFSQADIDKLFD